MKVRQVFIDACGNYEKRHDMAMRMMLAAVADQLNNEAVAIDFFCNFSIGEKSYGNNTANITVWLRNPL